MRKKENKVRSLIILGSLLILIGFCIFGFMIYKSKKDTNIEKVMINDFFDKDTPYTLNESNEVKIADKSKSSEEYIAIVEIEKINLKTGLVDKNSKDNIVSKHIQILNESDMPNVTNGTVILAAHSGTSKISYFKNLDKLITNDKVNIYYGNKKYIYEIYDINKQNKTGKISFKDDVTTKLIMTTCDKNNKDKQLIVVARLKNIESY